MNINYWNHIESMEPNKYSQKTSCHFLTSLTLGQYIYIYIPSVHLCHSKASNCPADPTTTSSASRPGEYGARLALCFQPRWSPQELSSGAWDLTKPLVAMGFPIPRQTHMGGSINGGTPIWMVYN